MRTNADRGVELIDIIDYKILERKYIDGLESMSEEDIAKFLSILQENRNLEFAQRRIPILMKKIEAINKLKEIDSAWELAWKTDAYEYIDITNRWLELGATWKNNETITKWSYRDEVFYTWFSGLGSKPITVEIINTRKADESLKIIINSKTKGEMRYGIHHSNTSRK